MRHLPSLALVALLCLPNVSAAAGSQTVLIDQSLPLSLPPGAQRVMIGNPAVADINVLDVHTAVLLGRGYGTTNLLILDAHGRTLLERQIVVGAADLNRVSLYRGDGQNPSRVDNFTCSPRCERTPMPGEVDTEYSRYSAPYNNYASRMSEAKSSGGAGVITKPMP